jgi:hypothetical protein
MSEYSVPQQGILVGDASRAPYDASEWAFDHDAFMNGLASRANFGVLYGYDNGTNFSLEVTPVAIPSMNVELKIGAAMLRGVVYVNDATITLAIAANASGNSRIDTVVLRYDYVAQTIRAVVRQGTPAASPVPPTLTQSAGTTWEIPIADVFVSNGVSSIVNNVIHGRQEFCNVGEGSFEDGVLNNSGGVLQDGDVVVWDSSAARGVTTTTQSNNWKVAGVVRGRIASGARGRIQSRGFGFVAIVIANNGNGTVTNIGTMLVAGGSSTPPLSVSPATNVSIRKTPYTGIGTDGQSTVAHGRTGSAPAQLGFLMETLTTGVSGSLNARALCYIDVQQPRNPHRTILKTKGTADNGTFTSGSWVTRAFSHIAHGAELDTAISATINANNFVSYDTGTSRFTLQPGHYLIKGWSAGYRVDGHLTRLQDITNAATVVVSQPGYSPSAADSTQSFPEFETFLIVETATAYELQARCTTTRATDGMGKYVSFGGSESVTFTYLEITRYGEVYT